MSYILDTYRKAWPDWADASDVELALAVKQDMGDNRPLDVFARDIGIQLPGKNGAMLRSGWEGYKGNLAETGAILGLPTAGYAASQRAEADALARAAQAQGMPLSSDEVTGIGRGLDYAAGLGLQSLPYIGRSQS